MAVNNSLQKASNQRLGIGAYLTSDAVKNRINQVIGGKDGQRFISSVVSAVQANPALQDCSNSSILSAALLGESLKLSPSPQLGQFYMIPFNDKERGKVAQFIPGYKGYIQLAIRSGYYKKLNVIAIKEGELIKFDPLNEEIDVHLIEDEEAREEAKTIGYYAMFEYTNGFRKAIYWSKKKMENHALKYSKGYAAKKGFTFWEKDFDSMAFKTMLKTLISKWGIMSIDMQTVFDSDSAIINEDGSRTYVETDSEVINEVPVEQPIEAHAEVVAEPVHEEPAPAPTTARSTRSYTRRSNIQDALFGGEN